MESFQQTEINYTPASLRHALSSLSHNGDADRLYLWIKENGIQTKPFEISSIDKKTINFLIEFDMSLIEKELDYKSALHRWKLLQQSGLLTEDILKSGIESYLQVYMLCSPEEIKNVEERSGKKINHYSAEFIQEFLKDLQENIRKELEWKVDL
jgi:hypothetical protein